MPVTFGFPSVTVPVLSSATICIFPAFSRDSLVLKRMPFFAPTPLPTIMATGVASPSAQGQEMTRTQMAYSNAFAMGAPRSIHTIMTRTAVPITAGTKTADTASAILAIGAFVAAASLTMRMICEKVVSSPTRVARARMNPERFIVAAFTVSPSALSTGTDSPVRADSSAAVMPSIITPSTGMVSPGLTTKISPGCTSSMATDTSCPSFSMAAVFGAILIRLFKALVVRPLERDSSVFPTVISAGIMAADSK